MSIIIPITSYLPSMFGAMSRQREKKETDEEKSIRIKVQNKNTEVDDESLCNKSTCRNCLHRGLIYQADLKIGKCGDCSEEFSIEFLKHNTPSNTE